MDLQLNNQVVFVAGSSRGIGRAIAETLLAEGASIVLTGRDESSLKQTAAELTTADTQDRILAIRGDFSDAAIIEKSFTRVIAHFGKLDHLICNLGTGSGTPGWDAPAEDWTRLFEQNFFASTRLTQAAIPHMQTNGGSILYISSIVAVEATPAPLPYSAAKAALNNYSKNLAHQLAPQIRVNTLAPGNIFFPGGTWDRIQQQRPEAVEHMLEHAVPQHRFGKPQEIASLAAFLCSSHAAFITGATYIADGGQTHGM